MTEAVATDEIVQQEPIDSQETLKRAQILAALEAVPTDLLTTALARRHDNMLLLTISNDPTDDADVSALCLRGNPVLLAGAWEGMKQEALRPSSQKVVRNGSVVQES